MQVRLEKEDRAGPYGRDGSQRLVAKIREEKTERANGMYTSLITLLSCHQLFSLGTVGRLFPACTHLLKLNSLIWISPSWQSEIDKVKKRREERALEKAQHEEEMVSIMLCEASHWHLLISKLLHCDGVVVSYCM